MLREAARACGSLLPHLQPVGKRQSISKRNTSMKKRNFTLLWLALCILPTAMLQLRGRIRSAAVRKTVLWPPRSRYRHTRRRPPDFGRALAERYSWRRLPQRRTRSAVRVHLPGGQPIQRISGFCRASISGPRAEFKIKGELFEPYNVITGACGLTGRSGKSATRHSSEALVHIFRRILNEPRKQTQNL